MFMLYISFAAARNELGIMHSITFVLPVNDREPRTVSALGTSPEGFKLVRFVVRRCIVNNANPATLLWKIKRRRELQKRDGARTSPIVLAERELNLDQVLWEVQSELENELLSSDLEI